MGVQSGSFHAKKEIPVSQALRGKALSNRKSVEELRSRETHPRAFFLRRLVCSPCKQSLNCSRNS
jgi:hypothetical protein